MDKLFKQLQTVDVSAHFEDVLELVRQTVGRQRVVVGNIPLSRAAEIMVLADLDLKMLSQGLLTSGHVASMLDRLMAKARAAAASGLIAPPAAGLSRFWLCAGGGQPVIATNDVGAVWLEQCQVVVRTERQMATSSGALVDTPSERDADADTFSLEFSNHFSKIAASGEHPSLAALENLYRLRALMEGAVAVGALEVSDLSALVRSYRLQTACGLGDSVPGLANGRSERIQVPPHGGKSFTSVVCPFVAGGVELNTSIQPKDAVPIKTPEDEVCRKAVETRPSAHAAVWIF